ncbi:MAG: recombinase [Gammaproteobacteria bacterium RIFCSPHIGHO2_12_FULL_35_23]|nr:MAG: recombinase [Gammaproteobacteria bacterium RIFCSPHIGHO2_12_FULL_35_23]
MSYLMDTNVLSELIKPKANKKVLDWVESIPNESLYISVLTLGEIRKGLEKVSDIRRKERLRVWLEHELPAWFNDRIKPIDIQVVDRWGRLQAEIKRPVPVIDSLLAATALHFDFALVTRNNKDFAYPSLEVINPWS